ncbi:MAG TPA: TRAP transporter small permease subunit [Dehalococcoidia bacterium]|nr:TRAP transporter small permease subunit [Dehalococcoidia bacterium]
MTVIRRITEGIGRMSQLVAEFDKWIIIAVILATTYEVFMRYVMNAPTIWAWAITQMLGAVFIALGLANNHRINANVRVDIISMKFSPRFRAALEVVFTLLFFFPLFFVVTRLFVQDAFFALAINQVDNSCAWSPITWPYKMAVAAGMVLLFVQGIATFLKDIMVLKHGGEQPW